MVPIAIPANTLPPATATGKTAGVAIAVPIAAEVAAKSAVYGGDGRIVSQGFGIVPREYVRSTLFLNLETPI